MLIPERERSLDELRDLAERNGYPRNVVKPISMIVYEIPDEAFRSGKRRGRPPKSHSSETDQGVNDGN